MTDGKIVENLTSLNEGLFGCLFLRHGSLSV